MGSIKLYDVKKNKALHLTVIAMLCALAVAGRLVMSSIPNVQPVTAIIILTAIYLGIFDSILSSFVVVIVTNLVLSHGVWSVYQFFAWAIIGIVAGLLFKKVKNPYIIILFAFAAGYFYGAFVSIFAYKTALSGEGSGYIVYWLSGILYDTYHALGNAVFTWFLYPMFKKLFAKE